MYVDKKIQLIYEQSIRKNSKNEIMTSELQQEPIDHKSNDPIDNNPIESKEINKNIGTDYSSNQNP